MRNKAILLFESVAFGIFLLSLCGIGLVVLGYTPTDLGPAALTFWFIGVLICASSFFFLIDYNLKLRKPDNRLQPRKAVMPSLRTALLLGLTLTILLALSSLRSLSLRDIILFVITVILIELYFRTRKKN